MRVPAVLALCALCALPSQASAALRPEPACFPVGSLFQPWCAPRGCLDKWFDGCDDYRVTRQGHLIKLTDRNCVVWHAPMCKDAGIPPPPTPTFDAPITPPPPPVLTRTPTTPTFKPTSTRSPTRPTYRPTLPTRSPTRPTNRPTAPTSRHTTGL
jgi:hypothetical protein